MKYIVHDEVHDDFVSKLYEIFMNKYLQTWKELGSARRTEFGSVWNGYVESVGGRLEPWGTATVRHARIDGNVLIRNPYEITEGRNVSVTYICLSKELAMKILVLGLP